MPVWFGVGLGVELRGPEHDVLAERRRPSRPPAPRCCRRCRGETFTCRCSDQLTRSVDSHTSRYLLPVRCERVPVAVARRWTGRWRSGRTCRPRGSGSGTGRAGPCRPASRSSTGWPPLSSSQLQRVVAAAGGEVDLLAGDRVAGEVAERVALVRRGRRAARGPSAANGAGRRSPRRRSTVAVSVTVAVAGAVRGPVHDAVGGDGRRVGGGPGDRRAVLPGAGQGEVAAHVVGVARSRAAAAASALAWSSASGMHRDVEGLRRRCRAAGQGRGQGDVGRVLEGAGRVTLPAALTTAGLLEAQRIAEPYGAGGGQRQVRGDRGGVAEATAPALSAARRLASVSAIAATSSAVSARS